MKNPFFLFTLYFTLFLPKGMSQNESYSHHINHSSSNRLTLELGLGIHTNFATDLILSNYLQWNVKKFFSVVSYSSYNINNITQRNFQGVRTDNNFSVNQKFGIGTTVYSHRKEQTFMILAGVKFTSFSESVQDQDTNLIKTKNESVNPDYGIMYRLIKGGKNKFISFRFYVPLYAWPIKGFEAYNLESNLNNIALEIGLGVKLK